MDDIVKRLRRTVLLRDVWYEPEGEITIRVYPDMEGEPGVYSKPVNPDGPEASDIIERQHEALVAAERLARSVSGSWDAFERALRSEIGNTNYSCVEQKLADFRSALAAIDAALEETEK